MDVGDQVRIKSWDELAAIYPMSGSGIETPGTKIQYFMKLYCGKEGVIIDVYEEKKAYIVKTNDLPASFIWPIQALEPLFVSQEPDTESWLKIIL